MNEFLHVVAGVIYNPQGKILLARRPFHAHQGGLWEFPGGKCEVGESASLALARELHEELGLFVQQARPLIRIPHVYPDKKIFLDVWHVEKWYGQVWGRENQTLQWCSANSLKNNKFPAANYPIITAIQLPSLYLITPEPASSIDKAFFYRLEKSLDRGISLVQLRAKNLAERDYCYCAEKALTLCNRYAAQLLINTTPEIVLSLGADGVHLNSERLLAYTERPLPAQFWVAASCHQNKEVQQANLIGTDFMVLGSVHTTASHPQISPLGWLKFRDLAEPARCPVFALGGMKVSDVPKAWTYGAQGIAAIRALWNKI